MAAPVHTSEGFVLVFFMAKAVVDLICNGGRRVGESLEDIC